VGPRWAQLRSRRSGPEPGWLRSPCYPLVSEAHSPDRLGLVSREATMRWRHRLLSTGKNGKTALGGILIVSGLLILFHLDQALEAWFVRVARRYSSI